MNLGRYHAWWQLCVAVNYAVKSNKKTLKFRNNCPVADSYHTLTIVNSTFRIKNSAWLGLRARFLEPFLNTSGSDRWNEVVGFNQAPGHGHNAGKMGREVQTELIPRACHWDFTFFLPILFQNLNFLYVFLAKVTFNISGTIKKENSTRVLGKRVGGIPLEKCWQFNNPNLFFCLNYQRRNFIGRLST